jgi:NADPH:quinone reductase-like Zn-dependent oxidoreductase
MARPVLRENGNAAEAATITCAGVTAWRGLVAEIGLKGGDVVLVQGTGGVSIYGLQIAKAFGCTVIATLRCVRRAFKCWSGTPSPRNRAYL